MSRAVVILGLASERKRAADWCLTAPSGTTVEFKESKRSDDQNRKMWACLTDIARQVTWPPAPAQGVRLTPDDWKILLLDALGAEMRMIPNTSLNGFVALGRSSSRLTKKEFADLIEIIHEFGARYGVVFSEPEQERAA